MGVDRIVAASEADFTKKAAVHIASCIQRWQSTRPGCFVLGLTGTNGHIRRSRAADVFRALGASAGIDWARVIVFLVDERYGFDRRDESNDELVRQNLIAAIQERGSSFPDEHYIVPDVSITPVSECVGDYGRRLVAVLDKHGPPNLVTLGLAADLSVAAIFPEWYRALPDRWAAATSRSYGVLATETTRFEVPQRISVNLRVLRSAEMIVVFLGGACPVELLHNSSGVDISDMAMVDSLQESTPMTHEEPATLSFSHNVQPLRGAPLRKSKSSMERACDEILHQECVQQQKLNPPPTLARVKSADDAHMKRSVSVSGVDPDEENSPASPLSYVMKYCYVTVVHLHEDKDNHNSIVVFGCAGDLAKKKTIPAIFNLYKCRTLPTNVHIICCDDLTYHNDIRNIDDLWCRRLEQYLQPEGLNTDLHDFRELLRFSPIKLDDAAAMATLDGLLRGLSGGMRDNRIFYLAQPPFLFEQSVRSIRQHCWSEPHGWVRVIVEKPFGRDLASARDLSRKLAAFLAEQQIFRIDHYLAKTMVLNILTLRFANRELGRLFHADNVANVRITFKEDIGVEGRAGYFNNYGIIRDIMQNHLLQLLTLVTMEAPASLRAEDVRNEKVKVLKQIRPVGLDDCVVGQYEGYQEDPDIQKINAEKGHPSKCPTFATCVLYLDNERWSGVPLILKAGKHLEQRSTIMRLQFKKAPPNSLFGDQPQNELVMRVQPNEAIYYRVLAKTPGISSRAHEVRRTVLDLDLRKLEVGRPPEAYEKLIHDVLKGESHNFVRADEVEEGWRIFDPLLRQLEGDDAPLPVQYPKGGRGPLESDKLINSTGFRRYTKTGVEGLAQDDFD
mmetsp:Transcript_76405/g.220826  ORF Transcript_76405/g.220826 Transcript_76405/m.220826 type:complete len:844 (+) Transcript_76405:126-2657(+)